MARKYKLTISRIMEAAESGEDIGFCLACGLEHEGIEPDAREYECDECEREKVYGAEELLLMYA